MLNTAELFLQEICILYMYIYQSGILLEQGELMWKCKLLIPSYIFFCIAGQQLRKCTLNSKKFIYTVSRPG